MRVLRRSRRPDKSNQQQNTNNQPATKYVLTTTQAGKRAAAAGEQQPKRASAVCLYVCVLDRCTSSAASATRLYVCVMSQVNDSLTSRQFNGKSRPRSDSLLPDSQWLVDYLSFQKGRVADNFGIFAITEKIYIMWRKIICNLRSRRVMTSSLKRYHHKLSLDKPVHGFILCIKNFLGRRR